MGPKSNHHQRIILAQLKEIFLPNIQPALKNRKPSK